MLIFTFHCHLEVNRQCEMWTRLTHNILCPGVMYIVFIRAGLIIEKYFQFSQYMHVSNHLFSLCSSKVCILHRTSKYISVRFIDQQYRTLYKTFIKSDHLWKHFPKVLEVSISLSCGIHIFCAYCTVLSTAAFHMNVKYFVSNH